MIVICLEGCHGCGKTTLGEKLTQRYEFLDEAFMDMPTSTLHPQSLTMEVTWLSNWFQRLLRKHTEDGEENKIYIADRSPYSAEFYSDNGYLLKPIIGNMIKELKKVGVHILCAYIDVRKDILWDRIQSRLKREPFRKMYKEDKYEWMQTTLRFYESHDWDIVVPNNSDILNSYIGALKRFRLQVPGFEEHSQEYFERDGNSQEVVFATE